MLLRASPPPTRVTFVAYVYFYFGATAEGRART
jgi:hypothetical protein